MTAVAPTRAARDAGEKARARDAIVWMPVGASLGDDHGLQHPCPVALAYVLTTREALDPMATGACRFCGELLPVAEDFA